MNSFIVRLEDFYRMTKDDRNRMDINKSHYVIPKYQREYAWDDTMILDLINDIEDKDKFLGIIILDAVDDHYEIIDGQQRITTCYMILVALYNAYLTSPREQERIKSIIQPYGDNILVNDSIGEYLTIRENRIEITISEDLSIDIYCQREDFLRAYKCVEKAVNNFAEQNKLRNFYRKLRDCKFLILVNDDHGSTKPVEQMFLDINEKSKLLDPADIFKGHCFENFDDEYADDLKELWVELKKCSISFKKFGIKNLSEYIYDYLLITDNNKITEKLKINGKHYLYGYDMDATENLLKQMIAYGESVVCLYENIDKNEYYFEDLCLDAKNYKATKDHKILKAMFKDILSLDAQYCKLPVMYMVSVLSANSALVNEMQFDTFKRIITNLYVYAVLFALSSNKKSKQVIDYTIRNALNGDGDVLINTLKKAKELRESRIDEFTLPSKCSNFEMLACIYSIMDNYVSSDNWITRKYDRDDDVNLEHFVMPDNDSYVVNWIRENEERTIIPIPIRKTLVKEYKKYTVNYLLIDEKLNRLLRNYDIVEKIKLIKEWFRVVNDYSCLPKHIRIFIEYIEKMDLYQELVEMKSEDESDKEIFGRKYFEFLDEFFSEQNQSSLLVVLKKGFETTFHN